MEQKQEQPKKQAPHEKLPEAVIRIFDQDIPTSKNIYVGLTRIKGVSWAVSNAICLKLGLNKRMRVSELSKDTIAKIENTLANLELPHFLKNRRKDLDTGEDKHLLTTDLDIAKEFDIKRLKKIKSYKGIRHSFGLPVRGQRTRSHFKRNKGKTKVGGVHKKKNEKKA